MEKLESACLGRSHIFILTDATQKGEVIRTFMIPATDEEKRSLMTVTGMSILFFNTSIV
jgi:hypothetical protein